MGISTYCDVFTMSVCFKLYMRSYEQVLVFSIEMGGGGGLPPWIKNTLTYQFHNILRYKNIK